MVNTLCLIFFMCLSGSSLDVSTVFTEVILEACLLPTVLPDKFGLDYTMLVAVMHSRVGSEVGEYSNNSPSCILLCDAQSVLLILVSCHAKSLQKPLLLLYCCIRDNFQGSDISWKAS